MSIAAVILPIGLGLVSSASTGDREARRLRSVILSTRHMGAHGMGYNTKSMVQLSKKLHPGDVPSLVDLMRDRKIYVGAQFALASQCEASLDPVATAAHARKIYFLDAEDVMGLIAGFDGCTAETRRRADELKQQIGEWRVAEQERIARTAKSN